MSKFRCEYDIPTVSYSQIFLTELFRLRIPCSKSALFLHQNSTAVFRQGTLSVKNPHKKICWYDMVGSSSTLFQQFDHAINDMNNSVSKRKHSDSYYYVGMKYKK